LTPTLVVDADVALKWVLPEAHDDRPPGLRNRIFAGK
jgi:hypothetical protein